LQKRRTEQRRWYVLGKERRGLFLLRVGGVQELYSNGIAFEILGRARYDEDLQGAHKTTAALNILSIGYSSKVLSKRKEFKL
jgi:hypothetical protein